MTPEQITNAVKNGSLTNQQAIHLFAAVCGAPGRPADANALQLPCEQCGALTPLVRMVSYKVWCVMPGLNDQVSGYDEHDQHFACSHACAEQLTHACISQHIRPDAERRIAEAQASQAPQK